MFTLITGTPGAGKTLYAIDKLLLPLVGSTVMVEDEETGEWTEHPRRIFTNINGLQIDHDKVESGAVWEHVREGTHNVWKQRPDGNKLGLHNWHEWAPVGAVLVVDEFQKVWPPRANGAPIPPDVSAMDTHRHQAVDFIVITQSKAYDAHIRGLIGRHLHVRKMGPFPLAIVYEWDHCSVGTMFSKALSKRPYRYNRKVYALYKSARAHTKQPRATPTLLYVVLAAAALAAWKIPESYARITGKADQHLSRTSQLATGKVQEAPRASAAPHVVTPALAAASSFAAPQGPSYPTHMGCIKFRSRCECFDAAGGRFPVKPEQCDEGSHRVGYVLPAGQGDEGRGTRPSYPSPLGAQAVPQPLAVDQPSPPSAPAAVAPAQPSPRPDKQGLPLINR